MKSTVKIMFLTFTFFLFIPNVFEAFAMPTAIKNPYGDGLSPTIYICELKNDTSKIGVYFTLADVNTNLFWTKYPTNGVITAVVCFEIIEDSGKLRRTLMNDIQDHIKNNTFFLLQNLKNGIWVVGKRNQFLMCQTG